MNVLAVAVAGPGLVQPGEPVFAADDEAVLRGRAVFETVHVYAGAPFRFDDHLARLRASSASVRLPDPDMAECGRLAQLVLEQADEPELALRLYWTGSTLVATAGAIDPELERLRVRGLRLAVVRWPTGALASAKSMSYAENMWAQDHAVDGGADDALLVAPDCTVLEAPTANVWWREGERLLTPSLALPILAGVTRAVLVELAPAAGYTVEDGAFPAGRLTGADEVFLSSSVREVMPVTAVDGTAIGDGKPGPAAAGLQQALRQLAGGPAR
jgi:branched-subunit amino acid aminotransferase/4-amino-4-deoxychorismate lyase